MSKRHQKQSKQKQQSSSATRFATGTQVRVKSGTIDPNFSDIPLGGWAGIIKEIDQRSAPPLYLITWNERTLHQMHPIYQKRCEREGLDSESMWLEEGEIEPDTGDPVAIEQPTKIVTRPLDPKDQDDRVSMALGLTADDPLSDVDHEALVLYYRYLAPKLSFPIPATWEPEDEPSEAVQIVGLVDPDDDCFDETYGLLCEVEIDDEQDEIPLAQCDPKREGANGQLLSDYLYWFWNYR